jgi:hypothetical protein
MATTSPSAPSLGQALARKKANPLPAMLLAAGLITAVAFAILGYLESQKTEKVAILTRDVAFGHVINAEDVGLIEVPLHRPKQLAGIPSADAIVGKYAARTLGANDLLQPAMLMAEPPTQPVYPNGEQLADNMVPVPFSVATIGPVTYHDRVNIGFSDSTGSPDLCDSAKKAADGKEPTAITIGAGINQLRPYACRLLSYVRVLFVDEDSGVAYLEMTPYQAQTIWALQATSLQLWGERYGVASDTLPTLTRLDIGQVNAGSLLEPVPTAQPRPEVTGEGEDIGGDAGGTSTIPGGAGTLPGSRP